MAEGIKVGEKHTLCTTEDDKECCLRYKLGYKLIDPNAILITIASSPATCRFYSKRCQSEFESHYISVYDTMLERVSDPQYKQPNS